MSKGSIERKAVASIEQIIGEDVGRNISKLVQAAKGGLYEAAYSLSRTVSPKVGIVTGFYIPGATPPAAETDGPPGALMLAESLASAGIETVIYTDSPCLPAVQAIAGSSNHGVSVEVLPSDPGSMIQLRHELSESENALTHLVSIERVGPGSDGVPRNMRGLDISDYTAPAHLLFSGADHRKYCTIAIGDGGNEIGMGALPSGLIGSEIDQGELIGCTVPCDHLIVCGVSNWGGFALPVALSFLRPDLAENLLKPLTPSFFRDSLAEMVQNGPAVDGVTGKPEMSVDRIPLTEHETLLVDILGVLQKPKGD